MEDRWVLVVLRTETTSELLCLNNIGQEVPNGYHTGRGSLVLSTPGVRRRSIKLFYTSSRNKMEKV